MATRPLIPSSSLALLGNYDGATVGVLLVDHDGAAAADESMEFVSEVAGNELGSPTVRGTVDVTFTVEDDEGVLDLDPEGDTYAPDTTGVTPAGAWFYDTTGGSDAARRLLCFLPVAEAPGFADWPLIAPADGLARIRPGSGEFQQLSDVDWSTPPTDGQAFVWDQSARDGAGALVPTTLALADGGNKPSTVSAFVLVDGDTFGDPTTQEFPLPEGAAPIYLFAGHAIGDGAWEFAGLYDGHATGGGTALLTRHAHQPVVGDFFLTRSFIDASGHMAQEAPFAADEYTPRLGYVSPVNGIDLPVFTLLMEHQQPGNQDPSQVHRPPSTDIAYTPAVTGNWTGADPTTVAQALDRIAAALGPIA